MSPRRPRATVPSRLRLAPLSSRGSTSRVGARGEHVLPRVPEPAALATTSGAGQLAPARLGSAAIANVSTTAGTAVAEATEADVAARCAARRGRAKGHGVPIAPLPSLSLFSLPSAKR